MPSSSSSSETLFQAHYSHNPSSSDSGDDDDTSAHPPLQQPPNFFAPPFYNRPPTPLPPSPSLTSLLRPSRPTTPDSSDNELSPNNHKSPLPRASPIVPTYEYYGFVLYLFSSLAFLIYLLWSYLPSPFLHAIGVYYYPNRWWSLAIPAWLVALLCYIYVALAAYNTGHLTLGMESVECVVDEAANIAIGDGRGGVKGSQVSYAGVGGGNGRAVNGSTRSGRKERGGRRDRKSGERKEWRTMYNIGTDAVMDVPLGGVCEVLYGDSRDLDPEDELYG